MRLVVLVLALSAGVVLTNLASPQGLHQNDEDVYFGVARTMLASGDYVVPLWDGKPYFLKPPLLYWMECASMGILGPSRFAARLVVAVTAVLAVLATVALGRRLLGSDGRGALAGLIAATTLGFLQYGRVAMMDVPLALCLVCAAWAAWRVGQGDVASCYGLCAAIGAGLLLKGPATALVAGGGGVAWLLLSRRCDPQAAPVPWPHVAGGLGLLAAMVAPWPLALQDRGMYDLFHRQFIVGENLGKFNGPHNPFVGMVLNYLPLLLPWTLLVLGALWVFARATGQRTQPAVLLPLCFFAVNLAVYSLPAIKWPQYLLPSLPLLAIVLVWAAVPRDAEVTLTGPIAVPLPVKIGAVVTGSVFLLVTPVLAVGSRLFPAWDTRALLFVLVLALAITALALLAGTRLFTAGVAFAVVLMCVSMLTPALTLERLPAEVGPLTEGHALMTYGVPPYGYELMLGRAVGVHSEPDDFRREFGNGVDFIVGDTELNDLMRAGAFDLNRAEMLTCWRKWRRRLNAGMVIRTIFGGTLDDLTENVCLVRYKGLRRH